MHLENFVDPPRGRTGCRGLAYDLWCPAMQILYVGLEEECRGAESDSRRPGVSSLRSTVSF